MRDNPNLSSEQIDRIRSVAQLRSVQAGEVLYEPSQPDVPLIIVLEGSVSISRTGTEWLEDSFILDNKGFIVTGHDLAGLPIADQWPLHRAPLLLETSIPGVFAVGDARAGSIKRVASAVGEGSMAVHLVHRYLAECASSTPQPDRRR